MKDLTSLQTRILKYLLEHRAADVNEIARSLSVSEKQVAKEIRKVIAGGWLEPRLRVMEDKLPVLGYPVKIRVDLILDTAADGRKEKFPKAHSPQALAKAVAEEFQERYRNYVLLGQAYATLGDRVDATFSCRSKNEAAEPKKDEARKTLEEEFRGFLESLPGVHRVVVRRQLLIEE